MKKIDKQLDIEAELTSGIYDSPDGASVVIVHGIKTPLDWETLPYVAAVKEKALLEGSPDQLSAQRNPFQFEPACLLLGVSHDRRTLP